MWFSELMSRELYRELGYSSIHQYASEALGFSSGKTYQFIRLARQLEKLPAVKESLAAGEVSWTKARTIAGVASAKTAGAWVEIAKNSTSRQLEQKVKRAKTRASAQARASGQLELVPTVDELPAGDPTLTLRVDFTPEQFARCEAQLEKLRKSGKRGSRADLILEALEALLHAESNPETETSATDSLPAEKCTRVQPASPYQIIVRKCPDCGEGHVQTSRGEQPLSPAALEAIECDARVWAQDQRNQAAIPPSVRLQVLSRDGFRCRSKGCTNTRFLEIHHRKPRVAGGSNEPDNLISMCASCHRLLHEKAPPPLRSTGSRQRPRRADR